jgi:hypothetical protein
MKELIDRIEHDIKCAEVRRDAFDKGSSGYIFNNAVIVALKTVLFDMKELKLTNKT